MKTTVHYCLSKMNRWSYWISLKFQGERDALRAVMCCDVQWIFNISLWFIRIETLVFRNFELIRRTDIWWMLSNALCIWHLTILWTRNQTNQNKQSKHDWLDFPPFRFQWENHQTTLIQTYLFTKFQTVSQIIKAFIWKTCHCLLFAQFGGQQIEKVSLVQHTVSSCFVFKLFEVLQFRQLVDLNRVNFCQNVIDPYLIGNESIARKKDVSIKSAGFGTFSKRT